jgi:2-polyprenyl-3-methyl-5-hydroxy-6-metoxy-1,4-benzoquinol methylase
MDEISKEYVISFFNKTLRMHGDRPEALRWTAEGQRTRFRCLLDIAGDINGKKVLDFGCGKGDFYQFLMEMGITVEYSGYDINENLISLARKKFPECDFRVFDIDGDVLGEAFDYIFLCGVFNLKVKGLDDTVKTVLQTLFRHCKIAMAFNALSAHNPKKDYELYYHSPEELFRFAMIHLSPYIALRHDRIPYDFVLFIYRDPNAFRG